MRLVLAAAAAALLSVSAEAAQEARIETSRGTIVIALDGEHAPVTVANFVRYAKAHLFNGTIIYRVVPGYVIQAGSFGADGKWRQVGKAIPLETATGLSNVRGAIAMAREDKLQSAKAEFFINLADNAAALDAKPDAAPNTTGYAVFGHVTAGMDVVDAIAGVPLGGGKGFFPAADPKTPIVIKTVTIATVPDALPAATPADTGATPPSDPTPPAQ